MRIRKFLPAIAISLAVIVLASPVLGQGTTQGAGSVQAPRHPEDLPTTSCPDEGVLKTGVFPFRLGPFPDGRRLINYATIAMGQQSAYVVFAGAPENSPAAGLLRVWRIEGDPCAAASQGQLFSVITDYTTAKGPLWITSIDGQVIVYSSADGTTGRFDSVSRQFAP